jgi:hypothetical protein
MRIAWFRPTAAAADNGGFAADGDADHLAEVVGALRNTHAIEYVDERRAHDFVWQHARGWFDLCVYELDNTARHQYMWPYLLHYPGVLALQSSTVHDARRARLVHEGRQEDYRTEVAFAGGPALVRPPWHMARGRWPMLRVPVAASRLTVVADTELASDLASTMPESRVRVVAAGVAQPATGHRAPPASAHVTVAVAETSRREVVERAAGRVSADGAPLDLAAAPAEPDADVVVALRWPLQGRPLVSALRGMAAGKATIVAETYSTAEWPALDPQTWRVRDQARTPNDPVVVSVDPRDEEHSLVLALRRLATDTRLRADLGRSARAWWAAHATIEHAVAGWLDVLNDAAARPVPVRPDGWPAHLHADGSRLTRQILAECGLERVPGQTTSPGP